MTLRRLTQALEGEAGKTTPCSLPLLRPLRPSTSLVQGRIGRTLAQEHGDERAAEDPGGHFEGGGIQLRTPYRRRALNVFNLYYKPPTSPTL